MEFPKYERAESVEAELKRKARAMQSPEAVLSRQMAGDLLMFLAENPNCGVHYARIYAQENPAAWAQAQELVRAEGTPAQQKLFFEGIAAR